MNAHDVEFQIPGDPPLSIERRAVLATCSSLGEVVISVVGERAGRRLRYVLSFHPRTGLALRAQVQCRDGEDSGPFHLIEPSLVPGNVFDVAQTMAWGITAGDAR